MPELLAPLPNNWGWDLIIFGNFPTHFLSNYTKFDVQHFSHHYGGWVFVASFYEISTFVSDSVSKAVSQSLS